MKVLHVFTIAGTAESFFDGQFKYLKGNGYDMYLACTPNDTVYKFAERNGVKYEPVEIPRAISPLNDFKTLIKLIKVIRRNNIDVVFGHTPMGALLAMIASFLCGVKTRVYLRHGVVYTTALGMGRRILKMEEKFVSLLSTHIVNVSPSLGKLAVADRLNKEKKQAIWGKGTCGGIDTKEKFNPSNLDKDTLNGIKGKYGICDSDYVIGFCGRLCKDKGIIELIEAFNLYREKHKEINTKLLLVGDYDVRDILPDKVKEAINKDKNIIHTGHIFMDEIQYYYPLMDIFVFPSHREGFGMSVIEASAMKKPILVARSHGCVDTIKEHGSGEYIDLSPESICKGIEYFADIEKRKQYGEYGRKFVRENFDYSILWPQILEYYNKLISK